MTLKEGIISNIRYTKTGTDEVTNRTIIPTTVPFRNIKAIDVSSLSTEDQEWVLEMIIAYREYVKMKMATIFKFEDWMEHVNEEFDFDLKWRTFKPEQMEILK